MDKFLKNVEIKNFKSIKDLKFEAKKVNVFIGKPNVGKSNILEALSILGSSSNRDGKFLSNFIRYETFENLFFDQDLRNEISINTNKVSAYLSYNKETTDYNIYVGEGDASKFNIEFNSMFDKSFYAKLVDFDIKNYIVGSVDGSCNYRSQGGGRSTIDKYDQFHQIKKYDLKKTDSYRNKFPDYLYPPYGDNLFSIIQHDKDFRSQLAPLFSEYGLSMVLKIQEQKFEIQKNIDGIVYSYPYTTIADTLQRYIFYLTAIKSNKESILLLEEPEVHSFPPYTGMLADKIALDETNQYFITTHSPYLLHTLIENVKSENLGLFLTYYENYETKVKQLSDVDIQQIVDDSIDVFFNLDRFIENEE
jgi:AAA15 family ATPase/GTPase